MLDSLGILLNHQTLQQFIIEDLNVKATIKTTTEYRNRVTILKNILQAKKHEGFTISVTSEQASVLAAHIAQTAITELRQENEDNSSYNLLALYLPEGETSTEEADEVAHLIKTFINADEVIGHDIAGHVKEMEQKCPHLANDRGQMKTRVRTAIQHMHAKERNHMVVGSGHSAQHVLGEATLHGETTISDILPLTGLTRHQVNQMLHHLNAPETLLANVPSASKESGISFATVDKYLGGVEVETREARTIEQRFLTTEKTRRAVTPFFTKFDHYKIMCEETSLLAVA